MNLQEATDLGCSAFHPSVDRCADTDVVERARERGFNAVAYGWTTKAAVQQVVEVGPSRL